MLRRGVEAGRGDKHGGMFGVGNSLLMEARWAIESVVMFLVG